MLQDEDVSFLWRSQEQHMLYFVAYTLTWQNVIGYLLEDETLEPDYRKPFSICT